MIDFSPFLIVGSPRSGTTLLTVLLDRHPELCCPPETYIFHCLPRNLRVPSGLTRQELIDQALKFDFIPRMGLKREDVLDRAELYPADWGGVVRALLETYAHGQGKSRVGEKTASHLREVPRILEVFPAAKIIWIVRDGRDVCEALMRGSHFHSNLIRHSLMWCRTIQMGQFYEQRYPRSILQVRFERLIEDPDRELATICAFLGVAFTPQQLDTSTGSLAVPAEELGYKSAALGKLDRSKIGAWRHRMTPREQLVMQALMQRELRLAGYEFATMSGHSSLGVQGARLLRTLNDWRIYDPISRFVRRRVRTLQRGLLTAKHLARGHAA